MDITLTPAEEQMFTDLTVEKETVEEVFHRILSPMLRKHSESSLQVMADAYRQLTPDLQLEILTVVRKWQESKMPPPDEVEPAVIR